MNLFDSLRRRLAPRVAVAMLAGVAASASAQTTSPSGTTTTDPYVWLEDVHGARAMAWVKAENAKTLAVLQTDPNFATLYAQALAIAQAKDRVPIPAFIAGQVYNFWQDDEHVRGIWRHTTPADYASASPAWTTTLDLDELAKTENANWVWKGADCAWPAENRCLIFLSDGGEDAVTVRELDLTSGAFVKDGFTLTHGKQRAAWEDADTLLVSRAWSPGDLTASGYPFIVKRLKRGQPLSSAVEVFRGAKSDGGYGVTPIALHDGAGHSAVIIARPLSTFEAEYYLVTPGGVEKLRVPLKSQPSALVAGRLLFSLQENWSVDGSTFPQGSLVSLDLAATSADPKNLKPTLVDAPGPRETLEDVEQTSSRLLLITYENVRGRAWVYAPSGDGGWSKQRLDLPDNSSIVVDSADEHGQNAYLTTTSFLIPSTIWRLNAGTGELAVVKNSPARFDASNDVVEQREATSKDGTRIPYFIVHPKNMKLDGNNPTLLYAYGGFGVSMTPNYNGILGKLWLERGGVYVLANIRGGGEFGPAWHDAGLTTHRQRIYDDFAAVAQDLIATKVTSPRRLGIQGGSNGGLLMGVEFTQHPQLWRAVDIQVPLLDMLRFEQIQAGASWTGEYGSVSNPEQRAFLASISPYNNLKPGVKYPEALIWTTTKDDRVGPQHARKFAAKLGAMHVPYLFYEVTEGGHGSGANLRERAFTSALEMTYFIQKLMD
ncbi:MAG TPA: prolyl oligopeptidase family serine peptidase [Candidatus Acidoferrum sp.]|jgi:prolyl oligopeptidase|nr:prolyl oligopeptidase family serine peptidase [Candidatus Acidoferrum sp.]